MKKFLSFLLVLSLCGVLTACGSRNAGNSSDEPQAPTTTQPAELNNNSHSQETEDASDTPSTDDTAAPSAPEDESSVENGILIVYFTYGENAPLADGVDASTSASIQYRGDDPTGNTGLVADLIAEATGGKLFSILTTEQYPDNYDDTLDVAQDEKGTSPELTSHIDDLDNYDTVFLGFLNWNNDAPRIIYTFLESENLSGKTIVPFCTSGGSGIANSVSNICGLASGATWMEGRRCYGNDTVSTLTDWVSGLGLDITAE